MGTGAEIGLKYVGIIVCSSPLLSIIKPTFNAEILCDCCGGGGPRLCSLLKAQASLSEFGNKMLLHISSYSWFESAGVWMEGDGEDSLKLIP